MDNHLTEGHSANGVDRTLNRHRASHLGILSQRVFHSPIVKWIFPARIREEKKNDVVFIGENLIELKEWDAREGMLRDVAAKADFGSKIRCGSVLGERRAFSEHAHHADAMDSNQSGLQYLPPQILVLVLDSCRLALLIATEDTAGLVAFQTHIRPLPSYKPLEQIGKLIATDSKSRAIAVSATERNLILYDLNAGSQRDTCTLADIIVGEFILPVDMVILKMDFLYPPKEDAGRVMLVLIGVKEGKTTARVYSWDSAAPLHPGALQLFKQTLGREHGMPISLIPLKTAGYFMLVEEQKKFLYLVSTAGSIEQTDSATLESARPEPQSSSFVSGISCRKPLWINWARPVRNQDWAHEVVYLGREDGAIQYVQVSVKPFANRLTFDIFGPGGKLEGNIDTAFAILDMRQARNDQVGQVHGANGSPLYQDYKLGYPDALVAAGNLSDGGLYEIGFISKDGDTVILSRAQLHQPQKRVTLRNWAPLSAVAVITKIAPHHLANNGSTYFGCRPTERERLVATSGKEPYGTIAELRFGFEVQCRIPRSLLPDVRSQDPNFDFRYCTGIWPVALAGIEVILLFSFPWRTVFAKVDTDTLTLSLVEFVETRDEPTLSATKLVLEAVEAPKEVSGSSSSIQEILLQITPTQIRLLKVVQIQSAYSSARISASLVKTWSIENAFVAASLKTGRGLLLIATQARHADVRPQVSLSRILLDGGDYNLATIGESVELNEEISCIAFLEFPSQTAPKDTKTKLEDAMTNSNYAAVGTVSGVVHIFAIDDDSGLEKLIEYKAPCSDSSLAGHEALESIASIKTLDEPEDLFVLLCGSRGGVLHAFHVQGGNVPQIKDSAAVTFGNASLHVLPDTERLGCAFVCCGSDICHVDFSGDSLDEYRTTSIFFTDPLDDSFAHANLNVICHLPGPRFTGPLQGCLMGLSNSEILAGNVKYQAKHLPLRRRIPGTPTKLLYSDHLKSLVVGSTLTQIYRGKRYSIPAIGILDLEISANEDASQQEIDEYDFDESSFRFAPGEQLCDIIDWFTTKDSKLYHLIVAATSISVKDGDTTGRIVYLQPKQSQRGRTTLKFRFDSKELDPVSAICQNDQGSLIYCCGNELKMRTYDPETQKFNKRILTPHLPSPGIQVTARGALVVVTTQLHSTLIFCFDEVGQLIEADSDTRPRAGTSHLVTDQHEFTLMTSISEGSSTVNAVGAGIRIPGIFEATLPCRIIRLTKAKLRPRWKQGKKIPTVVERDIVGVATDGSLFVFNIIHNSAWRLLYFIQTLCLRNSRICPLAPEDIFANLSLSPPSPGSAKHHIDGDILKKLLDMKDPRAVLSDMLDKEPIENGIHPLTGAVVDYGTVEERRDTFRRLIDEAVNYMDGDDADCLGHNVAIGDMTMAFAGTDTDPINVALKYMRAVLELPF